MKITNRVAGLILMVFAGGCAHPGWGGNRPARDYGMVDPDRALEKKLRFALNGQPELADIAPEVLISAQNGTVTLSGAVPSEQARQEIDGIVRNTRGVAVVNDQLQPPYTATGNYGRPARIYSSNPAVEPRQGTLPVPAGDPALSVRPASDPDRPMAERVTEYLRAAALPPVSLGAVAITVSGSQIYVDGTVATEQQHQAIISTLEKIQGVRTVYDRLK